METTQLSENLVLWVKEFNIIYWSNYKAPNKGKSKRKKTLAFVDVNSGSVRAGLYLEELEQVLQDM